MSKADGNLEHLFADASILGAVRQSNAALRTLIWGAVRRLHTFEEGRVLATLSAEDAIGAYCLPLFCLENRYSEVASEPDSVLRFGSVIDPAKRCSSSPTQHCLR